MLRFSLCLILLGAAAGTPGAAEIPPRPTLYLVGDSTVANSTPGLQGWGRPLVNYFDTNRLAVVNLARGGRSSRTYFAEGLWSNVVHRLRPGDYVMMQFGHNDAGPLDTGRARASLPGGSDEARVVTNQTSGVVETVQTYGWYLRRFIADTRERGATPIVLSPIARNQWRDGKVIRATDTFSAWARAAAETSGAKFIDLNHLTATRFEQEGRRRVSELYFTTNDHTHTTPAGADAVAQCVVDGLRTFHRSTLAEFLRRAPLPGALETPRPLLVAVIGDSTVANYPPDKPGRGWGMYLAERFTTNVIVTNLAANGRSAKTFIREGRWQRALELAPDFVLIQFGHNDSHAPGKPESTDAATDYREFLRQYVREARAHDAAPILITPMLRRTYDDAGALQDILQPYADAMKAVGAELDAPVIDLHSLSRALYEKLGPEAVAGWASAPHDRTHFNEAGARAMAELVLGELPRAAPRLALELQQP